MMPLLLGNINSSITISTGLGNTATCFVAMTIGPRFCLPHSDQCYGHIMIGKKEKR